MEYKPTSRNFSPESQNPGSNFLAVVGVLGSEKNRKISLRFESPSTATHGLRYLFSESRNDKYNSKF